MARTHKDYKQLFEEKLRKESGFEDLEIDWSTYHRTAPVYFRSGDPSVCSSFWSSAKSILVIRKVYGKYKREHCIVQFDKSLMTDFELWCKSNLAKLYKKHGVKNIEIRL